MQLTRLVYMSDIRSEMTEQDLLELVAHSHERNRARDVTGMLLFTGRHFLQVLEGHRLTLAGLYSRIASDTRHECLQRMMWEPTNERLFPDWGMQLVSADALPQMGRQEMQKTVLNLRLVLDHVEAKEAIAVLQTFRQQLVKAAA